MKTEKQVGTPDKNILWEAIYGKWYDPPKIGKDGKVVPKK